MFIIGITGPTGAGKSLFSHYLRARGITVIDADEVYHSLLIPPSDCLDALRRAFGNNVFSANGTLDRPALSKIVFGDPQKLTLLNQTVLGFVLERIRQQIRHLEQDGKTVVAVDAPTLIESGFHLECNRVISVLADPEIRTERILLRDKITREAAQARIRAQKSDDFYQAHSHFILTNNTSVDAFFAQCDALSASEKLPITY